MKKILFISSIFAPDNAIGAIRSTKFAKYLVESKQYEIIVFKEKSIYEIDDKILQGDIAFFNQYYEIDSGRKANKARRLVNKLMKTNAYLSYSSQKRLENEKKIKKKRNLKKFIARFLVDRMNYLKEKGFAKNVLERIKKEKIEFDVIYSSFGPMTNHYIASKLKKKYRKLWLADYRDPIIFDEEYGRMKKYLLKYNNISLRECDRLICCSSGCEEFLKRYYNGKINVITNGYDKKDIELLGEEKRNDGLLHLCYCGHLYLNRSNLSILFKCVKELYDEGKIDIGKIVFDYAGDSVIEMEHQLNKYGIKNILRNNGFVPREKALLLEKKADILLLASWNTTTSKGVLTGKFLEYMMMEKPIIAIVAGDVPNSDMKLMIDEGCLGVCCEEANVDKDYTILKNYFLEKYNEFYRNEHVECCQNKKYVEQFDYKYLANKLNDIIEEMMEEKKKNE